MIPELLHEYRLRAVERLEYACAGAPKKDSPRHLEIKEDRRVKVYSSCADLAHWLYFRLGVRSEFINRDEHHGWKPIVNVSRLVSQSVPYTGQRLEGGDVIVIANKWPSGTDAHVICIVDQLSDILLATAESGLPGNGLQNRKLPMKRKIRVVLPLEKILDEADAAGLLVQPEESAGA
jgi:hypothetical protein